MSKTTAGNFFEDFRVGQEILHATPRTLTQADAALNIALYGSRFAVNSSDVFARAIGLPHARWIEAVTAVVVRRPGAEVSEEVDTLGGYLTENLLTMEAQGAPAWVIELGTNDARDGGWTQSDADAYRSLVNSAPDRTCITFVLPAAGPGASASERTQIAAASKAIRQIAALYAIEATVRGTAPQVRLAARRGGERQRHADRRPEPAVARERHFGRAADACFVSQPTLSVAVKKLEDELDVKIFERGASEISITPLGEQIVRQAQQVIEQAAAIKEIAKRGKDPISGPLRLGIIYTIGPYLLPDLVKQAIERVPQMPLIIQENFTARLLEMLRTGDLDAAIPHFGVGLHRNGSDYAAHGALCHDCARGRAGYRSHRTATPRAT